MKQIVPSIVLAKKGDGMKQSILVVILAIGIGLCGSACEYTTIYTEVSENSDTDTGTLEIMFESPVDLTGKTAMLYVERNDEYLGFIEYEFGEHSFSMNVPTGYYTLTLSLQDSQVKACVYCEKKLHQSIMVDAAKVAKVTYTILARKSLGGNTPTVTFSLDGASPEGPIFTNDGSQYTMAIFGISNDSEESLAFNWVAFTVKDTRNRGTLTNEDPGVYVQLCSLEVEQGEDSWVQVGGYFTANEYGNMSTLHTSPIILDPLSYQRILVRCTIKIHLPELEDFDNQPVRIEFNGYSFGNDVFVDGLPTIGNGLTTEF